MGEYPRRGASRLPRLRIVVAVIHILSRGLRIVDVWTRRRVLASVGFSLVLAGLEMGAFALLYALMAVLTDSGGGGTQVAELVGRLLPGGDDTASATTLAVATISLLLLKTGLALGAARWQTTVQSQTEARLAKALYREYIEQPYPFHVDRNSTVLVRNLTDNIAMLSGSVIGGFITFITEGAVLLGIFVTLALVEPAVALGIAGFVLVVVAGYLVVITSVIERAAAREQRLTQAMLQSMHEGFAGIKAVHVFDVAEEVAESYGSVRDELARARSTTGFVQRLPQYYLEASMVVGIATAAVIVTQVRGGTEAYGLVGVLIAAALRVLPSVNRFLGALNGIRLGGASVDNLWRERQSGPSDGPETPGAAQPLPALRTRVGFHDVEFAYARTDRPALAGINLEIQAGESLGLVGASGSGKTTLVDILLGLQTPTSGAVSIDDVELTDANVGRWRRQVGYVPQDTFLMDGSIRANVLFYRPTPEMHSADEAVWRALEAAQLRQFVEALPSGLDTRVGERGTRLSGGQRQRLGIARALLSDPRILVLDEATSALDTATESAITKTIAALEGRVTMVIIAHRLSTVRSCRRIAVMEQGTITDTGTFSELLERNPAFSDMVAKAKV